MTLPAPTPVYYRPGKAIVVAERHHPIIGMILRRIDQWSPIEALVSLDCDTGTCVEHLKVASTRLLSLDEYHQVLAEMRATLLTCAAQLEFGTEPCHLPG